MTDKGHGQSVNCPRLCLYDLCTHSMCCLFALEKKEKLSTSMHQLIHDTHTQMLVTTSKQAKTFKHILPQVCRHTLTNPRTHLHTHTLTHTQDYLRRVSSLWPEDAAVARPGRPWTEKNEI